MKAIANLGSLWNNIQAWLFPMLEDELGQLDEKHCEFVANDTYPYSQQKLTIIPFYCLPSSIQ